MPFPVPSFFAQAVFVANTLERIPPIGHLLSIGTPRRPLLVGIAVRSIFLSHTKYQNTTTNRVLRLREQHYLLQNKTEWFLYPYTHLYMEQFHPLKCRRVYFLLHCFFPSRDVGFTPFLRVIFCKIRTIWEFQGQSGRNYELAHSIHNVMASSTQRLTN